MLPAAKGFATSSESSVTRTLSPSICTRAITRVLHRLGLRNGEAPSGARCALHKLRCSAHRLCRDVVIDAARCPRCPCSAREPAAGSLSVVLSTSSSAVARPLLLLCLSVSTDMDGLGLAWGWEWLCRRGVALGIRRRAPAWRWTCRATWIVFFHHRSDGGCQLDCDLVGDHRERREIRVVCIQLEGAEVHLRTYAAPRVGRLVWGRG